MLTFTYILRSISVLRWLNAEEGLQVVLQVVISRLPKKRLFWDMKSVFVHKYMYIKSLNAMGDSKLCVSKSFPKCYSWLACHWSYNGFILIHQFYITPINLHLRISINEIFLQYMNILWHDYIYIVLLIALKTICSESLILTYAFIKEVKRFRLFWPSIFVFCFRYDVVDGSWLQIF